jgi:hypothetical protein
MIPACRDYAPIFFVKGLAFVGLRAKPAIDRSLLPKRRDVVKRQTNKLSVLDLRHLAITYRIISVRVTHQLPRELDAGAATHYNELHRKLLTLAHTQHTSRMRRIALIFASLFAVGCTAEHPVALPLMSASTHNHYHIHAADASHDHEHDGAKLGHNHTHNHK